jgi:hypothetical protein
LLLPGEFLLLLLLLPFPAVADLISSFLLLLMHGLLLLLI